MLSCVSRFSLTVIMSLFNDNPQIETFPYQQQHVETCSVGVYLSGSVYSSDGLRLSRQTTRWTSRHVSLTSTTQTWRRLKLSWLYQVEQEVCLNGWFHTCGVKNTWRSDDVFTACRTGDAKVPEVNVVGDFMSSVTSWNVLCVFKLRPDVWTDELGLPHRLWTSLIPRTTELQVRHYVCLLVPCVQRCDDVISCHS